MLKIMVFLHGTAIMHRNAVRRPRAERVAQVRQHEESVRDFASYVPVGDAVCKLQTWVAQGALISYLSSHRTSADVEQDRAVLRTHHFPDGVVLFRKDGEPYQDVVERVLPDILIEDNCESIGGEREMTYSQLRPEAQGRIKAIVVKEFGGIDQLPDELWALASY